MTQIFANTSLAGPLLSIDLIAWLKIQLPLAGITFVDDVVGVPVITGSQTFTASSVTSTTLTRSGGVNWSTSILPALYLRITSGPGSGSSLIPIRANTTSSITVLEWPNGTPDTSSTFEIVQLTSVFKSSGVLNSIGNDFYMILKPASVSQVNFAIAELYDAQAKTIRKYSPLTPLTALIDTDGSVLDLDGSSLLSESAAKHKTQVTNVLSGTTYLDANSDGFLLGSGSWPIEVGVYKSVIPNDVMPIFAQEYRSHDNQTSQYGTVTREYDRPGQNTYNFRTQAYGTMTAHRAYAFAPNNAPSGGLASTLSHPNGGLNVARICFCTSRGVTSNTAFFPRAVGRGVTSMSGGVLGDTLSVSGPNGFNATYVLCQVSSAGYVHTFIRTS